MKIKTEKQLNLPQLIEWGFENDITNEWYRATNDKYISEVFFNISGLPQFSDTSDKSDLFTVEVEEEVTEDTEFKSMVEVTTDGLLDVWGNANISAWKDVHSKEFHAYIDGEFKCIWTHEKGLVK
ncbi:MAG: hypothetical protein ACTH0S_08675 [Senegalia sp. (in: firmicutes)]